jgi:hypothetical protein
VTRIEFRLSMPSRGSWNGGWSGADRNYVIVRAVSDHTAAMLMDERDGGGRWYHSWDDGWAALVTARVMASGERRAKSDGFCGYDWMVDNIIKYGSPYTTGTTEGMVPAGHKR